jgi:hypothetical protein
MRNEHQLCKVAVQEYFMVHQKRFYSDRMKKFVSVGPNTLQNKKKK